MESERERDIAYLSSIGEGEYCMQEYFSFIQHESLELVCSLEDLFFSS